MLTFWRPPKRAADLFLDIRDCLNLPGPMAIRTTLVLDAGEYHILDDGCTGHRVFFLQSGLSDLFNNVMRTIQDRASFIRPLVWKIEVAHCVDVNIAVRVQLVDRLIEALPSVGPRSNASGKACVPKMSQSN
jgi:hypothetical protein